MANLQKANFVLFGFSPMFPLNQNFLEILLFKLNKVEDIYRLIYIIDARIEKYYIAERIKCLFLERLFLKIYQNALC